MLFPIEPSCRDKIVMHLSKLFYSLAPEISKLNFSLLFFFPKKITINIIWFETDFKENMWSSTSLDKESCWRCIGRNGVNAKTGRCSYGWKISNAHSWCRWDRWLGREAWHYLVQNIFHIIFVGEACCTLINWCLRYLRCLLNIICAMNFLRITWYKRAIVFLSFLKPVRCLILFRLVLTLFPFQNFS